MKKDSYTKILVSLPPSLKARLPGGKLPPEWMRVSFIDEESPGRDIDRVLLPLEAFGDATGLCLCACHDGVPIVQNAGHVYVPASWIMREVPGVEEQVKLIARRVITLNRQAVG